jgi:signal peptidase
VLIAALLAGTLPSIFGYESFVVLSGSMEPTIKVGDLAVVSPTKPDQFVPGDIITYRTAERPDVIVTHRLIGVGTDDQGRINFQTKGDANVEVDQVAVDPNAVLGRVAYTIPKIGYLVEFAKRPEGKLLLIGLPGLLLVLDYFLGMRRRRKAEPAVTAVRSEAGDLVARGRVALQNGGTQAALGFADRAIAADPHLEDAWLLKAECLEGQDRLAVLRAGLTVNPGSANLKTALDSALESGAATG